MENVKGVIFSTLGDIVSFLEGVSSVTSVFLTKINQT